MLIFVDFVTTSLENADPAAMVIQHVVLLDAILFAV
jgi:hypothetical protein